MSYSRQCQNVHSHVTSVKSYFNVLGVLFFICTKSKSVLHSTMRRFNLHFIMIIGKTAKISSMISLNPIGSLTRGSTLLFSY